MSLSIYLEKLYQDNSSEIEKVFNIEEENDRFIEQFEDCLCKVKFRNSIQLRLLLREHQFRNISSDVLKRLDETYTPILKSINKNKNESDMVSVKNEPVIFDLKSNLELDELLEIECFSLNNSKKLLEMIILIFF
jgi:hypothetical protein